MVSLQVKGRYSLALYTLVTRGFMIAKRHAWTNRITYNFRLIILLHLYNGLKHSSTRSPSILNEFIRPIRSRCVDLVVKVKMDMWWDTMMLVGSSPHQKILAPRSMRVCWPISIRHNLTHQPPWGEAGGLNVFVYLNTALFYADRWVRPPLQG